MERKTAGQVNYEAYFEKSGGRSLVSGLPLPLWPEQSREIQEAWEAGAEAVMEYNFTTFESFLTDDN